MIERSKVEYRSKYQGYINVVVANSYGFRCGYVGIQPSHPLYGRQYNEKLPEHIVQPYVDVYGSTKINLDKTDLIGLVFLGDYRALSILVQVHGGLTFSNFITQHYIPTLRQDEFELVYDQEVWFFGFDCNHHMDAKDPSITSPEYQKSYAKYGFHNEGTIRTLPFCMSEVHALADQLKEFERLCKEV